MAEGLSNGKGIKRTLDALLVLQKHRIRLVCELDAVKELARVDIDEVDALLSSFARLVVANRVAEKILAER